MTSEEGIEKSIESNKIFTNSYSRIGNNLKKLVNYVTNQEDFMNILNETLKIYKEYPNELIFIKINNCQK